MKHKKFILITTLFVAGHALCGCAKERETGGRQGKEQTVYTKTIVCVGDSLTAGLGVAEQDAYPARLEKKLNEAGYRVRVLNAGISGETSSGALSRVNWVLKLKPDIVILETGANDGMRGVDPEVTKRNIGEMARIYGESGTTVVLAGMRMLTNMGKEYTTAFARIYPEVARKEHVILEPFFLEGVAGIPSLNQPDAIHPTAEGYRIVTESIYPYVLKALQKQGPDGQ